MTQWLWCGRSYETFGAMQRAKRERGSEPETEQVPAPSNLNSNTVATLVPVLEQLEDMLTRVWTASKDEWESELQQVRDGILKIDGMPREEKRKRSFRRKLDKASRGQAPMSKLISAASKEELIAAIDDAGPMLRSLLNRELAAR